MHLLHRDTRLRVVLGFGPIKNWSVPELVPNRSESIPVLFSKLTNKLHNGVLLSASWAT